MSRIGGMIMYLHKPAVYTFDYINSDYIFYAIRLYHFEQANQ